MARRNPLLSSSSSPSPSLTPTKAAPCKHHNNKKKKFGEVVGGTAAECAAICCCCPCTVMNLLVMVVYTVPAGLCKKAWRRRRQKRLRMIRNGPNGLGVVLSRPNSIGGPSDVANNNNNNNNNKMEVIKEDGGDAAVVDLEKELWETFYGTGFWRSSSQRDSGSTSRMLDTATSTTSTITASSSRDSGQMEC
ncbi:hypothetical protein ACFE04_015982 [Oxalis oulophora]